MKRREALKIIGATVVVSNFLPEVQGSQEKPLRPLRPIMMHIDRDRSWRIHGEYHMASIGPSPRSDCLESLKIITNDGRTFEFHTKDTDGFSFRESVDDGLLKLNYIDTGHFSVMIIPRYRWKQL